MTDEKLRKYKMEYGDAFKAGIGAEAIKEMLSGLNLETLSVELRDEMSKTNSEAKRKKLAKRLRVVEAFKRFGQQPRMDGHGRHPGAASGPAGRWFPWKAAGSPRRTSTTCTAG